MHDETICEMCSKVSYLMIRIIVNKDPVYICMDCYTKYKINDKGVLVFHVVDLPNGPLRTRLLEQMDVTYEEALFETFKRKEYLPNPSGTIN